MREGREPYTDMLKVWEHKPNLSESQNIVCAFVIALGNVELICRESAELYNRDDIEAFIKKVDMGRAGFYIGPHGQVVELKWSEGPGRGHECLMYSVDGSIYQECKEEIKILMQGYVRMV